MTEKRALVIGDYPSNSDWLLKINNFWGAFFWKLLYRNIVVYYYIPSILQILFFIYYICTELVSDGTLAISFQNKNYPIKFCVFAFGFVVKQFARLGKNRYSRYSWKNSIKLSLNKTCIINADLLLLLWKIVINFNNSFSS